MKLFRKIVDSITNEVRYVKYFIEYIVDFSTKKSENDFIVRTNVDSHLDKCKLILICFAQFEINIFFYEQKIEILESEMISQKLHRCICALNRLNFVYHVSIINAVHHIRGTLSETLTRMGEKDMKDYLPPSVTTCKMVYIPNIGYLLAITGWNPSPADNADLENLEFKFVSNNIRYYKSPSAKGFFIVI